MFRLRKYFSLILLFLPGICIFTAYFYFLKPSNIKLELVNCYYGYKELIGLEVFDRLKKKYDKNLEVEDEKLHCLLPDHDVFNKEISLFYQRSKAPNCKEKTNISIYYNARGEFVISAVNIQNLRITKLPKEYSKSTAKNLKWDEIYSKKNHMTKLQKYTGIFMIFHVLSKKCFKLDKIKNMAFSSKEELNTVFLMMGSCDSGSKFEIDNSGRVFLESTDKCIGPVELKKPGTGGKVEKMIFLSLKQNCTNEVFEISENGSIIHKTSGLFVVFQLNENEKNTVLQNRVVLVPKNKFTSDEATFTAHWDKNTPVRITTSTSNLVEITSDDYHVRLFYNITFEDFHNRNVKGTSVHFTDNFVNAMPDIVMIVFGNLSSIQSSILLPNTMEAFEHHLRGFVYQAHVRKYKTLHQQFNALLSGSPESTDSPLFRRMKSAGYKFYVDIDDNQLLDGYKMTKDFHFYSEKFNEFYESIPKSTEQPGCVGIQNRVASMISLAADFHKTYCDTPKFMLLGLFNDGQRDRNFLSSSDFDILRFIESLHTNYPVRVPVVFLVGLAGTSIDGVPGDVEREFHEKILTFAGSVPIAWENLIFGITENKRKIATVDDIYNVLDQFIPSVEKKYDQKLKTFFNSTWKYRTCEEAEVPKEFCPCDIFF